MESLPSESNAQWKWLYRVAGTCALLSAALIFVAGWVFMNWPPPGFQPSAANVGQWFAFFQSHHLAALFDLDLVMVADNVLVIPLFLALYVVLRRTSPAWTTLGVALALVGCAGYFAINPAFSLLSLSRQYAAATTDAERAAVLAAGQTILAIYQGTGFDLYILVVSAAGVILGGVMTRSEFGKLARMAQIPANASNPGMFLPSVGLYIGFIALLPLIIWYVRVGWVLLRLGGQNAVGHDSIPLTRELVSPTLAREVSTR